MREYDNIAVRLQQARMASSSSSSLRVPPEALLGSLDPWPSTFRLPADVAASLAELARRANVLPAEAVSAVILHCIPVDSMAATLANRGLGPWSSDRVTLYVRLPPPITWRLNRIVEAALVHDQSVSRTRLVAVGLMRAVGMSRVSFDRYCVDLRSMPSSAAALSPDRPQEILDLRRPAAGRRVPQGRVRRLRPAPKER